MKRFYLLIIIALITGACASSSKLLQKGSYDAAIEKSVQKLRKKPGNSKEILVLERAYTIVNEQNNERIRFLEREGNPRNIPEILQLYTRMKNRQSLVRTVTPLQLPDRMVEFQYIDYDDAIIQARGGAADFYYTQAVDLMRRNDKESHRLAWNNLLKVKEYAGDYKDVNHLLEESRFNGISRVLVTVNNRTHLNLAPEFIQQLLTVDARRLDNHWVEYYYKDLDESILFDYYAVINLLVISVSPDQVKENDRVIRKRIDDGFEYVKDARGNVVKDSLGNDIKVPKYRDLFCTLIESTQLKTVAIEGDIEILSENPRRLLKREPLGAFTSFEHKSARAVGDIDALDEDTKKLLESKAVPFPSEPEMIYRTADAMRIAIAEALQKNKKLIR